MGEDAGFRRPGTIPAIVENHVAQIAPPQFRELLLQRSGGDVALELIPGRVERQPGCFRHRRGRIRFLVPAGDIGERSGEVDRPAVNSERETPLPFGFLRRGQRENVDEFRLFGRAGVEFHLRLHIGKCVAQPVFPLQIEIGDNRSVPVQRA